jgi:hypothetical protein
VVEQVADTIVMALTVNVAGFPAADDVSRDGGGGSAGFGLGVGLAVDGIFNDESEDTVPVTWTL